MKTPSRKAERRGAGRPVIGDTKPCVVCRDGRLEFTERYRIGAAGTPTRCVPAWTCDLCPYVVQVRDEHQPAAVRAAARIARARARRAIMKATFIRRRANRALQKSLNRKKPT